MGSNPSSRINFVHRVISLEYDLEKIDDCKVKLYITIDDDEREDGLKRASKRVGREKQVSGFRKGKAPAEVILNRYRDEVFQEFLNEMVPSAVEMVRKEENLHILDKPQYDFTNVDSEGPVEFSAVVYLYPEFELSSLDKLKLDRTPANVTDEEIDNMLTNLAERNAELNEKPDLPADSGDLIVFDWVPDRPEWLLKGPHSVIVPEEQMTGTIEGQLIGSVKDETRTVSINVPEKEGIDGEFIDVGVKIEGVFDRDIPEIDDDLATKLGSEDLSSLREKVREDIIKAKKMEERKNLREIALDRLFLQTDIGIPSSLIEWYRKHLTDADKVSDEEIIKYLKKRFLIDKLGVLWEIEVEEEELKQEVIAMAQQMGMQEITEDFVRTVRDNLYRRKALDRLVTEIIGDEEVEEESRIIT